LKSEETRKQVVLVVDSPAMGKAKAFPQPQHRLETRDRSPGCVGCLVTMHGIWMQQTLQTWLKHFQLSLTRVVIVSDVPFVPQRVDGERKPGRASAQAFRQRSFIFIEENSNAGID
jgi:hypothetical protein